MKERFTSSSFSFLQDDSLSFVINKLNITVTVCKKRHICSVYFYKGRNESAINRRKKYDVNKIRICENMGLTEILRKSTMKTVHWRKFSLLE